MKFRTELKVPPGGFRGGFKLAGLNPATKTEALIYE
jgi:hypothetical protein